jgi:hypothetical protein
MPTRPPCRVGMRHPDLRQFQTPCCTPCVSRFPSPPVVSAALSGFVIGVILTLMASGVIGHASERPTSTPRVSTPGPVKSVRDQLMETQLKKIANRILGSDPAGPKSRVLDVKLVPVNLLERGLVAPRARRDYKSVLITFRLNDHPLGPTWRLREAKADVFALLRAIYVSSLPVYNTELVGSFTPKAQKTSYTALVAYLTYQTASRIPWKKWSRSPKVESQMWTMLDYKTVDRRFG